MTGMWRVGILGDYNELLARSDVDIVHIAPPVDDILACTIKAAEAGKHMVTGEPVTMTVTQADEMVHSVEKVGVECLAFQRICRALVPVWSAWLVR